MTKNDANVKIIADLAPTNKHIVPQEPFQLTVIKAVQPKHVAKSYDLKNGALVTAKRIELSCGVFQVRKFKALSDFHEHLDNLDSSFAITYGRPRAVDGTLVSARLTKKIPDAITRTKENFVWPVGPAIFPIDVDLGEYQLAARGSSLLDDYADARAVDKLFQCVFDFWRELAVRYAPSNSSCIHRTEDGALLSTKRGWHAQFVVDHGANIPDLARWLFRELVEAGFGYCPIFAHGGTDIRAPLDMAVYQTNRLMFESGPKLGAGLEWRLRDGVDYVCFDEGMLRTEGLGLSEDAFRDWKDTSPTVKALREAAAPALRLVREAYVQERSAALVARGMSPDAALATVEHAVHEGVLPPGWGLIDARGRALTVGDLLDNPKRYDRLLLRDPLEPTYDGGRQVAIAHLSESVPNIHSQAHGGMNYRLLSREDAKRWHDEQQRKAAESIGAALGAGAGSGSGGETKGKPGSAGAGAEARQAGVGAGESAESSSAGAETGQADADADADADATAGKAGEDSPTFAEIMRRIKETDDFTILTVDIPKAMARGEYTAAELDVIFKAAGKKAECSAKSIKQAYLTEKARLNATSSGGGSGELSEDITVARGVLRERYNGGQDAIYTEQGLRKWTGGCWKQESESIVKKHIHEVAEAAGSGVWIEQRKVNSALSLLQTEAFKNIKFDEWQDELFLNVANGELHLVGGQWRRRPAVREHYRTSQIPVAHDPKARAPMFEAFLDSCFLGDYDAREKKQVILEMMGYSLTPLTIYDRGILLLGSGANGKSVVMATLGALVGKENICAVQPSQTENKFQRGHMLDKLVNLVTELAKGKAFDDAAVKMLVSGEPATAEHKFGTPFNFSNHSTQWWGANGLPEVKDFSDGLFRRVILVTFNRAFGVKGKPISGTSHRVADEDANPDLRLIEKNAGPLAAELPGILNLCLEALANVMDRGGIVNPPSGDAKMKEWHTQNDQAKAFVNEDCLLGAEHEIYSAPLYADYKQWASEQSIIHTLSQKSFTERLRNAAPIEEHVTSRGKLFKGITSKRMARGGSGGAENVVNMPPRQGRR